MFQNENTFAKFKSSGKEDEFHAKYEKAVDLVKNEFGKTFPLVIGGEEIFNSPDGTFDDRSPADTSLVLGKFQRGTREHAKKAIETAKKSFDSWRSTPCKERVRIYRRAADIASEDKFRLSAELTFENGKNRYEAIADIDEGIDFLRYYSEELERNNGFELEMNHLASNEHTKSILKPYGVWSVISPFNFPFAIATGMSTGAAITGNTIVMKPASDTPLMAFELYTILKRAGLPSGVFNFLTGPGSTVGAELVDNPDIQGVVFTGSWDVGSKSIRDFEAVTPRPFIAEMGGKNATVVTARADLEKAAEGVMRGAFGYGGQKCSACSRVYVHESVKDEFVQKLLKKTSTLKVGDPTKKDVFLGPLINEGAYKNYQNYIAEAKSGGRIAFGGNVVNNTGTHGFFVEPTIIVDLPKAHDLIKRELFVPILTVESFSDFDDAIDRVNNVEYGLTSAVFSQDKDEIRKYFRDVQAGVVYANRTSGSTTGAMVGAQPFVGWKRSGSSGKGAGGPYYLQQFLREQSQTIYE